MEPEITEIASQLAVELPFYGTSEAHSKEEWRRTLRHARKTGFITAVTDAIEEQHPHLAKVCEELRQ